ncbi:MAG: hypothetical protein HW416_3508 [Chloroflexi bacterium]|nr:hypothetical protein [Chloroflexota bacterium]
MWMDRVAEGVERGDVLLADEPIDRDLVGRFDGPGVLDDRLGIHDVDTTLDKVQYRAGVEPIDADPLARDPMLGHQGLQPVDQGAVSADLDVGPRQSAAQRLVHFDARPRHEAFVARTHEYDHLTAGGDEYLGARDLEIERVAQRGPFPNEQRSDTTPLHIRLQQSDAIQTDAVVVPGNFRCSRSHRCSFCSCQLTL